MAVAPAQHPAAQQNNRRLGVALTRIGILTAAVAAVFFSGYFIRGCGKPGKVGKLEKVTESSDKNVPTDPSYGETWNDGIDFQNGARAYFESQGNACDEKGRLSAKQSYQIATELHAGALMLQAYDAVYGTVCSRDGREFSANPNDSTYVDPLQFRRGPMKHVSGHRSAPPIKRD